jgi:hypothetical protein
MATAGRTAAEQTRIDSDLEALRFHWGDAYVIGFDDEKDWHAKRRDGMGGVLTGANPDELYKLIGEDYRLNPVPRRYTPDES